MPTRILVVDDDPAILQMLELALVFEGYEVLTATDGLEATAVARESLPHVVLMDMMMPVMSGLEATDALHRHPATSAIPIALLTARAGEDDVWSGWQAGVDSYLTKPVDLDLLLAEIERLTGLAAVAS